MTPVSIDAVVDSYAEYLHANHPANFTRFDRTRSSDREAAMAEAIVFQILEELNLSPDINDKVNTGGADFICTGSYRSRVLRRFAKPSPRDRLVVEATSLDLGAVTIRSRIPNDIEDGEGGAFSLVTHSIRNKANDKATQLANYDIPGVLAIASSHAAIAALFNTDAAEYCLVSNPKLMTPVGGSTTQITDLQSSVFLKPGEEPSTVVPCRQSISAILLAALHGDRSRVCGILHPEPARPLDIRFFPNIPFIRLRTWPVVNNVIETEWVIGEPKEREFQHQLVDSSKPGVAQAQQTDSA